MAGNGQLRSWNDGAAKKAIVDFVARVTREGSDDYVAPESRIAVFDNDGTLWCEKPMPVQADFWFRRLGRWRRAIPRCARASRGRRYGEGLRMAGRRHRQALSRR